MSGGRKLVSVVAAALLLGALATACSDEDDPSVADATPVPTNVVPADEVGGDPVALDGLVSTAGACGIDGSSQWAGSTPDNTAAFERETDGGTEIVVIGSWPWPEDEATSGLASLTQALAAPDCNVRNRSAAALDGFAPPTVAFEAVTRPDDGPAASEDDAEAESTYRSTKRAYTWVDGTMVMVWLNRVDAGDPSTEDLKDLLDAQVAVVEDAKG